MHDTDKTIEKYLPVIPAESALPDLNVEKYLSDIPDENSLQEIPTESLLPDLQTELSCEPQNSQLDDLSDSPTSSKRCQSWGPKTKRFRLSHPKKVVNQEPQNNQQPDVQKERYEPTTAADRKAVFPKLPALFQERRKSVSDLSHHSKEAETSIDKKRGNTSAAPEAKRVKEVDVISEDEARKRKYQPQVVVEKLGKSVRKSSSDRHSIVSRDSSADSVKSVEQKKSKK